MLSIEARGDAVFRAYMLLLRWGLEPDARRATEAAGTAPAGDPPTTPEPPKSAPEMANGT